MGGDGGWEWGAKGVRGKVHREEASVDDSMQLRGGARGQG